MSANRKDGDYRIIIRVRQVPITIEDHLTLHSLLGYVRLFGWSNKICYHAVAGHMNWSQANQDESNKTSHALELLKQAKQQI